MGSQDRSHWDGGPALADNPFGWIRMEVVARPGLPGHCCSRAGKPLSYTRADCPTQVTRWLGCVGLWRGKWVTVVLLFPTLDGGPGGSVQPVPVGADRQGVAGAGKVQDVQVMMLEWMQRL